MKQRAFIGERAQPGALLAGALHWFEQAQQLRAVFGTGVLLECLAERQMLCARLRRQRGGVGGEKGEWRFLVLAVFGQIEMHPPDQIPGGVAGAQKILRGLPGLGQFSTQCRVEFAPQAAHYRGGQILRAAHGWRIGDQGGELGGCGDGCEGRVCLVCLVCREGGGQGQGVVSGIGHRCLRSRGCGVAHRRYIARPEVTPPRQHRRQCLTHVARAQLQQAVAAAACKSLGDLLR